MRFLYKVILDLYEEIEVETRKERKEYALTYYVKEVRVVFKLLIIEQKIYYYYFLTNNQITIFLMLIPWFSRKRVVIRSLVAR